MNTFSAINTLWVLVAAVMIFFMQAGFALLESGFTRAKNAGSIMMKNIMDFCIAVPVFWIIGFGIMYGSYQPFLAAGVPFYVFLVFQTCFCGTSATIVSGAMAERTKFSAYCLCSVAMSALIFPICGHWVWGHGWLYQLGFHDFAGGTIVHVTGGTAAFTGAAILGPRIGKYAEDGSSKAIKGHNLTIAALGMFILWFGWFGFNGGSTLSLSTQAMGERVGRIFFNTSLSAALSACFTMLFTWLRYKKPDISLTINGVVGGLVAVTAGCDVMTPVGAALTGAGAGLLLVVINEFIDKKLHVDDPVGAVGVHAGCGFFGTVMVGFFSETNGLIYGGGIRQLLLQCAGAFCVMAFTSAVMAAVFKIINKTVGLRVPSEEEIEGLDKVEHGLSNAYEGFMSVNGASGFMPGSFKASFSDSRIIAGTQLETSKNPSVSASKITKVEIITKQSKFEELKQELNKIGITGITVSQVLGCGMQKGAGEYYRGSVVDMQLLPKIKVEVVIARVPLLEVVNTAKRVLYTGHVGDGKLFIYTVDNVIKVRTGEEGYDAMQNDD